jgi:hypothetical protein
MGWVIEKYMLAVSLVAQFAPKQYTVGGTFVTLVGYSVKLRMASSQEGQGHIECR